MTSGHEQQMNDAIIEQAADWVTRIQSGGMQRDERDALRAWLGQSLEHARVFKRMSAVLQRTDVLQEAAAPGHVPARPQRWHRWTAVGASLAAALALVAVVFVVALPGVGYETAIGERRSIPLDDGSVVHLNALSRARISYAADARTVELLDGEAFFEVARDAARPFIVRTGEIDVRVLGTTFSVSAYGDDTLVAVVEGQVAVEPRTDSGAGANLTRGQQVAYSEGALGAMAAVDPGQVAAWRDGWLYHEQQPLQDLVDRLNRQYHGRIDIADPALAARRVNVVLRLESRAATLARLQQLLPVTVEEFPGERATIRARN